MIHYGRFRPKVKGCFENCTNVVLAALGTEHEDKLRYCEGWATTIMTVPHAWLSYEGELVEMTLVDREVVYGEHRILTPEQVRESVVSTRRYGPHTDIYDGSRQAPTDKSQALEALAARIFLGGNT